jgi:hypothetical protein
MVSGFQRSLRIGRFARLLFGGRRSLVRTGEPAWLNCSTAALGGQRGSPMKFSDLPIQRSRAAVERRWHTGITPARVEERGKFSGWLAAIR